MGINGSLSHNNEIIELNDQVEVISIDSTIITVKKNLIWELQSLHHLLHYCCCVCTSGDQNVQQSETVIVERLGKYHSTLSLVLILLFHL